MAAKSNDVPKPGKGAEPDPAIPAPEPVVEPDYPRLVDRELRVVDSASDAAKMWAPILLEYQKFQRTLKYATE